MNQSLAFWLRLLVKDPPLLSMKPCVEVINPVQQLTRTLGNLILRVTLIGFGRFLASVAYSLSPYPSL
jgi:hypothetical protein